MGCHRGDSSIGWEFRSSRNAEVQQQCGGIIEPKKLEVLVPGMFVSLPAPKDHSNSSGNAATSTSELIPNVHEVEATPDGLLSDSQRPQIQADFEASSSSAKNTISQSNSKSQRRGRQRAPRGGRTQWVKRTHEDPK